MYPKLLVIIRNNQFLVQDNNFSHFSLKKGKKKQFLDPEIGTADNKNAVKTPFFAILSPQKDMGGFVIDIQEKSQSLGSLGSLFLGVIAIFWQGEGNAPPYRSRVNIIVLRLIILMFYGDYHSTLKKLEGTHVLTLPLSVRGWGKTKNVMTTPISPIFLPKHL